MPFKYLIFTLTLLIWLWPFRLIAGEVDARYEILFSNNQQVMTVKACFGDQPPRQLVNGQTGASGFVKTAYVVVDDRPRSLVIRNGKIMTGDLHGQSCLHYQLDFVRIMQMDRDFRLMPDRMNYVRTRAGLWLWLPGAWQSIDVAFYMEADYNVTTPWQMLKRTRDQVTFRLQSLDDNSESLVYFGRFKVHELSLDNGALLVSVMGDVDHEDSQKLIGWVEAGAEDLTRVYGHLSMRQLPVMVFPIGPHRHAVPWGEVKRDGGCTVHLYVDQTRPFAEIRKDWTLVHELSHTLHPYVSMEGRWLTEGLATYYQNVLQARAGTISVKRGWSKLHEGFERGLAETEAGKTLKRISSNMRENHKYMRVYWSGTALWLRADWLLRTRHGSSLDNLMLEFQHCCLMPNRTWSAREFMQQLDRLSGTTMFSEMYTRYAMSDEFPDLADVYASLGLVGEGSTLSISDHAGHGELIQVIMSSQQFH